MKETEAARIAAIPEALGELIPNFMNKMKGVDENTINSLARAAGRELPEAYCAFLRWAGKKFDANLWHRDPRASRLQNVYQRGEWLPPEEYLLIAIAKSDVDLDEDLYLRNPASEEPSVVSIPFPQGGSFSEVEALVQDYGAPFSALLFGELFLHLHLRPMRYTDFLIAGSKRSNIMHEVHQTLKGLGFVRHPLSGKDSASYTRDDAAALLRRSPGTCATVDLGAKDLQALNQLVTELDHHHKVFVANKLPA